MYEELRHLIEKYSSICVFRHLHPDGDAIFTQSALCNFIRDNFPDKAVYACGDEFFDLYDNSCSASDEVIPSSLAIVVDTANKERVDDGRFLNCSEIVKIDHHIVTDNYGKLNIVNESASSASEVVADIFLSGDFADMKFSEKTAEFLLKGILMDSMSFKTSNTSAHTLMVASRLVEIGNLRLGDLNDYLFNESLDVFKRRTVLRSYLECDGPVGYLLLNEADLKTIGLSYNQAKEGVFLFMAVRELKAVALFAYNSEAGYYEGSLRSRREVQVNDIAAVYGGGGHKNAAGVKGLGVENCFDIVKRIKIRIENECKE